MLLLDTIDLSDTDGYTVLDMRGGSINSVDVHTLDEIIEIHQEDVHSKGPPQSDVDSWIADKITLLYNDNLLYTGVDNFSIAEGVIIENINQWEWE